jgi:hypothetical protein
LFGEHGDLWLKKSTPTAQHEARRRAWGRGLRMGDRNADCTTIVEYAHTMSKDEANRPIPDEPISDEPGPVWRIPAGAVRRLAKLVEHVGAWENVTIENRGKGYLYFSYPNADGVQVHGAAAPGDDENMA